MGCGYDSGCNAMGVTKGSGKKDTPRDDKRPHQANLLETLITSVDFGSR
jgi:hypothetical protein